MSVKNVSGIHQAPSISEAPKITITSLADELLLNTAQQGNFSPKETARLQRVNKHFREVFSSNTLWKALVAPRATQPTPRAQNAKEPLFFEDILGMPEVEKRALASIWEMPAPRPGEAWPYEFMRRHSNNRQIVYALIQKEGQTICFAGPEFKKDRDFGLVAVKQYGLALEHLALGLRADQEVALAAVRQNGAALRYAASALKADKEVVLAAVKQVGRALEWAAPALQADKEVVLAAIKKDWTAYNFASHALRRDSDAICAYQEGYQATSENLRNDFGVIRLAARMSARQ